jgi:branched-chain amino acid transport system permease protein
MASYRNCIIFGLSLAVLIAAPFILPEYLRFVLSLALINIVAVLGVNITMGYAGQISLGHAGFAAIGAYTTALLMVNFGISFWPAMIAGGAVAGLFGCILGLPAMRLGPLYVSMVTFGFGFVVVLILQNWYELANGPNGIATPVPTFFGLDLTPYYFHFVIVAVTAVLFIVTRNIVYSPQGRAFIAIRESEVAARAMGIDSAMAKTLAFALGAIYAGISGALFAGLTQFVNPDAFVFNVSISYVTMLILGGAGFMSGPIIGGILLTALPEILRGAAEYKDFITGFLLLVLLIFLPNGITGLLANRIRIKTARMPGSFLPSAGLATRLRVKQQEGKLFEINSVSVMFGGLLALRDVSFNMNRGQILGLIGPNGAGKTTLFNTLSGIYLPNTGTVQFDNQEITIVPAHKRTRMGICRTFQNLELFKDMSVLDNILVGAHSRMPVNLFQNALNTPFSRRIENEAHVEAAGLLDFVGLGKLAYQKAGRLSFGHQRLLEIARALAARPQLLMLDEPGAGLNSAELGNLMQIIARIRGEFGIAILLIGHTMRLVMGLSDKIVVLDHGEKIAEGSPAEIQQNKRVLDAYLGTVDA